MACVTGVSRCIPVMDGMPWQWLQAEQLARQAASTQSACTFTPLASEESDASWAWSPPCRVSA